MMMDDDNWIVFCSNISYSIINSDTCCFEPSNSSKQLSTTECTWRFSQSVSREQGIRIEVTCGIHYGSDLEKNKDAYDSVVEKWANTARLYISIASNTNEYASYKIKPLVGAFDELALLSHQKVLSFVIEISSVIFKYTISGRNGDVSSLDNVELQKTLLCLTLKKSVDDNVDIVNFRLPIKTNRDDCDFSILLNGSEYESMVRKLGGLNDQSMVFPFGNGHVMSFSLSAILFPVVWNKVFCNVHDLENLFSGLVTVCSNGDYCNEAITLFLQFMHGKKDGFNPNMIKPEHFIDFIKLASSLDILSGYICELLNIFGNYAHNQKEFIRKCLLEVLKYVIAADQDDMIGFCKFVMIYFSISYESWDFADLIQTLLFEHVKIAEISVENENKKDSLATLIPSVILSERVKHTIFDLLRERFNNVIEGNNLSVHELKTFYRKILRDNNWLYINRTFMINPVQHNVCVCIFENTSACCFPLKPPTKPFNNDYNFLNLVNNVIYVDGSQQAVPHDFYFNFRFSQTRFDNFVMSLPSPVAYFRWPWFKSMIDSGMQESRTKCVTMPESITPEIMFAIACCLSNLYISESISPDTLTWFRSDESSIVGIKDENGIPRNVFKQLFV